MVGQPEHRFTANRFYIQVISGPSRAIACAVIPRESDPRAIWRKRRSCFQARVGSERSNRHWLERVRFARQPDEYNCGRADDDYHYQAKVPLPTGPAFWRGNEHGFLGIRNGHDRGRFEADPTDKPV